MAELKATSRVSEVEAAKRAVERQLADVQHAAHAAQQRATNRIDALQAQLKEASEFEAQYRAARASASAEAARVAAVTQELEEERATTRRAFAAGEDIHSSLERALAAAVRKEWDASMATATASAGSRDRSDSRSRVDSQADDWSTLLKFLDEAGQQAKVFAPGASAAASLQEMSSAVGILETCAASAQRLAVVETQSLEVRCVVACEVVCIA